MNEKNIKLIREGTEGVKMLFGMLGKIYSAGAIFFSILFIIAALLVDSSAFHVDGIPDWLTRISLIFVVVAILNLGWIVSWLSRKAYRQPMMKQDKEAEELKKQ